MSNDLTSKHPDDIETIKLMDLYFDTKYIEFGHKFNSYNQFLSECVLEEMTKPTLIYENSSNGKVYRHLLKYDKTRLKEPSDETSDDINTVLFPEDFKTRHLTYSSRLVANVEQILEIYTPESNSTESKVVYTDTNVTIGKIPIMIRSNACITNIHKDKENNECDFNAGCYFIIKGAEKVIVPQENTGYNRIFVFPKKGDSEDEKTTYIAQVFSKIAEKLNSNIQIVSVNIKKDELVLTMSQLSNISVCILFKALGVVSDKDIIEHITMTENDVDMKNLIMPSIIKYKTEKWKFDQSDENEQPKFIITQDDAINYLISKITTTGKRFSVTDKEMLYREKREYLHKTIFDRDFIPHMTSKNGNNNYNKACYLGAMCNKLLNYKLNRIEPDDRDNIINKRIDNDGILMGQIFKQAKKNLEAELTKYFKKKNDSDEDPINMIQHIKHTVIEQRMNSPLSNGTWPGAGTGKKGVAQMLQRFTFAQYTSICRRVASTQTTQTTKATGMRFVHNSTYGFYDPAETPEHGQHVGTVKHLSNIATITINSASQPEIIKGILYPLIKDLSDVKITHFNRYTKVFLNGEWLGLSDDPINLTRNLKDKRIKGEIEKQVSISYNINKKEIHISTDAGRLLRPLLRVQNNELVLTKEILSKINIEYKDNPSEIHKWIDFIMQYPETVDFVDPEEQETLLIAFNQEDLRKNKRLMNKIVENPELMGNPSNRYDENIYKRYTHCEIHPSAILGTVMSNTKLIEHNDAPRNYFAHAQHKQAMGIYTSNYRHRTDNSYILLDPQIPLVHNRTANYTKKMFLPYDTNITVAISQLTGYNQEDSMMINKGSIERGAFAAHSYKKESLSITKTTTALDEVFKIPDKNRTTGMKDANYSKLNSKGFVDEETVINNNDVIFGKTTPLVRVDNKNPEITEKDSSLVHKAGVPGVIDKVYTEFKNHEGYLTYSARIRQFRMVTGGDKFCSCYTSDHEIMTSEGWKFINEITLQDKIACIKRCKNKDGEEYDLLLYEYPLEIQEYDYEGELYHVKTNQIDLLVTPNHRMYVGNRDGKNYKIKEARELYSKRVCYKKNIELFIPDRFIYEFVIPGCDDLPELKLNMNSWLTFYGIWLAEGCLNNRDKNISISAHKQRVQEKLIESGEMLDLKTPYKNPCNKSWVYNSKQIYNYLNNLYEKNKAVYKYLPDWVFTDLTMDQCRRLIDGMMCGDGHTMDNGTRRYDTSSTKLADDFQRLCLHAGWSCNKALKYKAGKVSTIAKGDRKGETITSKHDAFRMTIITNQNRPIVNKKINSKGENKLDNLINFEHEETENCIKNKVYCCTVPHDGLVYVRRNGVVSVCGNSHGQKATVGYIINEEDMPYTSAGIRPDIIINSCCIPSRMTIGQLIEGVLNTYAGIIGKTIELDQFEHLDLTPAFKAIKEYKKILVDSRFQNHTKEEYYQYCSETLYSGFNGRKMDNPIFITPVSYFRLKHLTDDKVHARSKGPMTALLKQPPEGRQRDGGLRLGEMERDVHIAHGIAFSLKSKFMEDSDQCIIRVCSKCGLIARKKINKESYICDACDSLDPEERPLQKPYTQKVSIPYACKIFIQEMASIGILLRIRLKDDEFTNSI